MLLQERCTVRCTLLQLSFAAAESLSLQLYSSSLHMRACALSTTCNTVDVLLLLTQGQVQIKAQRGFYAPQ
jgi:hypothetical protein